MTSIHGTHVFTSDDSLKKKSIDVQFADCYRQKFGNIIDRGNVIPITRALPEHPESVGIWENLINQILKITGFTTTTYDRTIYKPVYKNTGETIYLIRQVDDFVLACSSPLMIT